MSRRRCLVVSADGEVANTYACDYAYAPGLTALRLVGATCRMCRVSFQRDHVLGSLKNKEKHSSSKANLFESQPLQRLSPSKPPPDTSPTRRQSTNFPCPCGLRELLSRKYPGTTSEWTRRMLFSIVHNGRHSTNDHKIFVRHLLHLASAASPAEQTSAASSNFRSSFHVDTDR